MPFSYEVNFSRDPMRQVCQKCFRDTYVIHLHMDMSEKPPHESVQNF